MVLRPATTDFSPETPGAARETPKSRLRKGRSPPATTAFARFSAPNPGFAPFFAQFSPRSPRRSQKIKISNHNRNHKLAAYGGQPHDPDGKYLVDCKLNGMARPVFIFALSSDDRVRDATIALLQFERWGNSFRSLGIFEDQEQINRKVLARFSDTCEKQFSSLAANRDRIARFLQEAMQ